MSSEHHGQGGIAAADASAPGAAARPGRRLRRWVVLLAAIVVAVGAGWWWGHGARNGPGRPAVATEGLRVDAEVRLVAELGQVERDLDRIAGSALPDQGLTELRDLEVRLRELPAEHTSQTARHLKEELLQDLRNLSEALIRSKTGKTEIDRTVLESTVSTATAEQEEQRRAEKQLTEHQSVQVLARAKAEYAGIPSLSAQVQGAAGSSSDRRLTEQEHTAWSRRWSCGRWVE